MPPAFHGLSNVWWLGYINSSHLKSLKSHTFFYCTTYFKAQTWWGKRTEDFPFCAPKSAFLYNLEACVLFCPLQFSVWWTWSDLYSTSKSAQRLALFSRFVGSWIWKVFFHHLGFVQVDRVSHCSGKGKKKRKIKKRRSKTEITPGRTDTNKLEGETEKREK